MGYHFLLQGIFPIQGSNLRLKHCVNSRDDVLIWGFGFFVCDFCDFYYFRMFPSGSVGKESTCNAGNLGSIPGLGRSPGGGHGNPLQHSCLENPHRQRSLVGYSPWGLKESDITEAIQHIAQNVEVWRFPPFSFCLFSTTPKKNTIDILTGNCEHNQVGKKTKVDPLVIQMLE